MKMFNKTLFFLLLILSSSTLMGQEAASLVRFGQHAREGRMCKTTELHQKQMQDPEIRARREAIERQTAAFVAQDNPLGTRTVITIPVVFHVLARNFNRAAENIPDARLQEQIDILNQDFSLANGNFAQIPNVFKSLAANCEIQFCLAKRTPEGEPSTGIVRKRSRRTGSWVNFSTGTEDMKYASLGGSDAWDEQKYLNIWVCDIASYFALGYAYYPGEAPPGADGVVLDYRTVGFSSFPWEYNLGRTATHEVGHYLNLAHTWGDVNTTCASDYVNDTPTQAGPNFGCPTFPTISCNNGPNGDNFSNYMDYGDDACMAMFTHGQKSRMLANFAPYGARESLLTSDGCIPVSTPCERPLPSIVADGHEAVVSWDAIANVDYWIELRVFGGTTARYDNVSSPHTLTGLTPNTNYEYRVRRVCPDGTAESSNWLPFSTAAANCVDANEPNNSLTAATLIPMGNAKQGIILDGADSDYFKFTVSSVNPTVYISLTNLSADYDLKLFGPGGRQIGLSQERGTTNEYITYTATNFGTYTIQVYGYEGASDPDRCYRVQVSNNPAAQGRGFGTAAKTPSELVGIAPNPAQNELNLSLSQMTKGENTTISLVNLAGQEMLRREMVFPKTEFSSQTEKVKLNVADLPNGMYILQVKNADMIENRKVMIQH